MLRVVTIASGDDDKVVELSSDEEDVVPLAPLWGPAACAGAPPRRFRGYLRGCELGSGGSGRVFVCSKGGEQLAVKTLDLRRLRLRADAVRSRAQLSREVEILTALPPHRGVVRMLDAFEEGNWFFMVLELCEHGDLFAALTSRRPPRFQEAEALHVTCQVVEGLSFLHGHGVIHRDLKLENVLVASTLHQGSKVLYEVKLTDFGLSKMVGTGRSEPHSCVGTKPYMAPEVAAGQDQGYDLSSDVWCLGVLLFVMVVGKFPFDSPPRSQDEPDASIQRLRRCTTTRGILSGLLQMEPMARTTVDALHRLEWRCPESESELGEEPPTKRPRAASTAESARGRLSSARAVSSAGPAGGRSRAVTL